MEIKYERYIDVESERQVYLHVVMHSANLTNIIFLQPYSYLQRYGYIKSMSDVVSHAHAADTAIRKFQRYAQLPVTGKMDGATKRKLTGPRCGAQDVRPTTANVAAFAISGIPVPSFRDMRRKKRYVQQGTKWQKQVLHLGKKCPL